MVVGKENRLEEEELLEGKYWGCARIYRFVEGWKAMKVKFLDLSEVFWEIVDHVRIRKVEGGRILQR